MTDLARGQLYVVSTPIGNLGDVSARAAEVLRAADAVLCEDTRHSRRLLDHLGSRAPTLSLHEHNEARRSESLVARLTAGETFALVSDAGTPLLSDPGARLVAAAIDAGVRVVPIPGPSALLAALVASGLDAERFTFVGFLARRGRERAADLALVAASPVTTLVYEAPGRVADTLADLAEACGADRPAAVARELTKLHEEVRRGPLGGLATHYAAAPARGEVVVVVAARPATLEFDTQDVENAARAEARRRLAAGEAPREVSRVLVEAHGLARNAAYRIAQEERACRRLLSAAAALLAALGALGAGGRAASSRHVPPALTIARLHYDGGGDWYANATSLPNLLAAVRARTTLRPARAEAQIRLDDERLADYPYLHVTGHGEVKFSPADVERLRAYLLHGGFLHADDNYGMDASFRREIARVFPDRPLVEVPRTHAIYHAVYDFPRGLPKIHEHDGKPPRGYGIYVGDRLVVFYTVECDLGNGWEDVGTYPNDPPSLHEQALRMGVNLFVYAVTSRVGAS